MNKFFFGAGMVMLSVLLPLRTLAVEFSQIFVFGDSLSDTGNIFEITEGRNPPSPPYFDGRYSDGPVWVEYLALELEIGPADLTNYAFGGATTGTMNQDSNPRVIGLQQQIERFVANQTSLDPDALYIIWAGANDYLGGSASDPTQPVNQLITSIERLAERGAQTFLIANLPDLGELPATLNGERSPTLTTLSDRHNQGLVVRLNALSQARSPDVNIIVLDVNTLFEEVTANPEGFGFADVTRACLAIQCQNPGEFLFWDDIHPTTAAHQQIAALALSALQPANVDDLNEPSPHITLIAGGLIFVVLSVSLVLKRKVKAS